MFVDGVGSDVEGEEFNSESCRWEVEEDEEAEENQAAAGKAPASAAAIPEKVFFPP